MEGEVEEVTEAVVEEAMEAEIEEVLAADTTEAEVAEDIEAELDGVIEAELESPRLLALPSAVRCSCSSSSLDPLMLVCRVCGQQQHAACYRILQEDGLRDRHCCVACCQGEDRPCTDPRLLKMSGKQEPGQVAMTCLYRRLLAALVAEVEQVDSSWIAARFGLQEETAVRMVRKAESEEVVGPAEGGLHLVNRGQLEGALKKYLRVRSE